MAAYERARVVLEGLMREHPAEADFQSLLANVYSGKALRLKEAGKSAEALAAFQQALAIQERLVQERPTVVDALSRLGATLHSSSSLDLDAGRFGQARDKLLEAVKYQKRALAIDPSNAKCRQFLVNHYNILLHAAVGLGDMELARNARRGLAEVRTSDPQLAELEQQLAAVRDPAELVKLARHAYDTQRFTVGARLYREALERDVTLVESRETEHAGFAAVCAVLAASGSGLDEPPLDDASKAKLRAQALGWLQAELDRWDQFLASAQPGQWKLVADEMKNWQSTPDLVSVRGKDKTAEFPAAERASWEAIWKRVDDLLTRSSADLPVAVGG